MSDEVFEPLLGRIRAPPSKRGSRYLGRVLKAAVRAGPSRSRGRRFTGSRIGRGAGIARALGARDRFAAFRSRRAIVKTRLVRLRGKSLAAARAHLHYIQRDGVQRDGSPGQLYSADSDRADGRSFLERCGGDRHQFRFILSAEDGDAYDDLKPLVRRFMAQMEQDLGTRLEWVAADHVDTGQPHSHVILRGRDETGQNLVIAREYIGRGMRERLAELVTIDLGPRQDHEISRRLHRDIDAERVTAIDRALLRDLAPDGNVAANHRDPMWHALRSGRLKKLEALGLAEELGSGRWRLAPDLEQALKHLGERGDIIRTMQRELTAAGLSRAPAETAIHRNGLPDGGIVGRVVARGFSDELADRHYLLVDGVDGRAHRIEIGKGEAVGPLPTGAIVAVEPAEPGPRAADRAIAEVALANGGLYSADLHQLHDGTASEEYASRHVRRLEAMRRAGAAIERSAAGVWSLGPDYLDKAAAFERQRAADAPARVELLSPLPLDQLSERDGATWLDRQLETGITVPARDSGFGRELRSALHARRQWLLAQGLAEEPEGGFQLRPDALALLQKRELSTAAIRLSRELALPFSPPEIGGRITGTLKQGVDLASGRFALIENSREFTLVPWREVLERNIGKDVAGLVRSGGISWSFGRSRGLEI